MKHSKLKLCVALIPFLLMTGVGAASAGAYVHGSICQPATQEQLSGYKTDLLGTANTGTLTLTVFCPSPIDHNVGSSLDWTVRVEDGHSQDEVACLGSALDSQGRTLGVTVSDSTSNGFVGADTLSFGFSATVGSSTYTYVTQCFLPPQQQQLGRSRILNLRVN